MVKFSKAKASDITRIHTSRSSKYDDLVDAALILEPEEALQVYCEDGEDPEKHRVNVSNAVRNKVIPVWQSKGLMQVCRIVKGKDDEGVHYTAIVCRAVTEEELAEREETRKKKAAALKKSHAKRKKAATAK